MADFLLEIGLEEIPARMIDAARDELARRTHDLLAREHLIQESVPAGFSSPRRIAVHISGVSASQADVSEEVIGPSTKIAYKDGVPTPAAEAFAKKAGVAVDKLTKISNAKG